MTRGRPCSGCTSPFVEVVNTALVEGESMSVLARRHNLPRRQLYRHKEHMEPDVVRLVDFTGEPSEVLAKLGRLNHELETIKERARDRDDLRIELAAILEQASLLETQAKIVGALPETSVNVALMTEWPAVLDALNQYPEARLAVVRALS